MQKPKKPVAPADPAIAEGQARARGRAIADEDARRAAQSGTASTALYGSEKQTLDKFEGSGDVLVQRRSSDSEETRYQQEAALQGVETDNRAKYVLAKRGGALGSRRGFSRGESVDIADPTGKPRGTTDALMADADDTARGIAKKTLGPKNIVKSALTGGTTDAAVANKASVGGIAKTAKKLFKKMF